MIFVTVGHHPEGFERLLQKLDDIAPDIDEEIIVQAGYNKSQPRHMTAFAFKPYEEVLQLMRQARVIVCHGGACVIDGLMLGKPLIVVPRFAKCNEARDDHQVDLAERLKAEGKAEVVNDVNELKGLLLRSYRDKEIVKRDNKLVNYLREQVNRLVKSS